VNTPAHGVFNLLLLGRRAGAPTQLALLAGALVCDIPMFAFYFVEKVVRNVPEQTIWTESYYGTGWQAVFDTFNSLPLIAAGSLVSWWVGAKKAVLFFASMALHVACDLPLHVEDSHRHFFPLSDWRFQSPVSYWDPSHYGNYFAPMEALMVLIGVVLLFRSSGHGTGRWLAAGLGSAYALYLAYVFIVWV